MAWEKIRIEEKIALEQAFKHRNAKRVRIIRLAEEVEMGHLVFLMFS